MGEPKRGVAVLGIFAADAAFRAPRQPALGETVLGTGFALGPGGKGSNQAVACARLGASVTFVSKVGDDPFADLAFAVWRDAGVTAAVLRDPTIGTGAAAIFVDEVGGDNAIIVWPGAGGSLTTTDVEGAAATIASARVFMTQLEQPLGAAVRALKIARDAGTLTILNPAPAARLDDTVLRLVDVITPNETEASALPGIAVRDMASANVAADQLLERGARAVVLTLGEHGALVRSTDVSAHLPAVSAGPVVDTTGAGDAFNGGLATALAEGAGLASAAQFAVAVAGLSVTRLGAAASMPRRHEVDALTPPQRP